MSWRDDGWREREREIERVRADRERDRSCCAWKGTSWGRTDWRRVTAGGGEERAGGKEGRRKVVGWRRNEVMDGEEQRWRRSEDVLLAWSRSGLAGGRRTRRGGEDGGGVRQRALQSRLHSRASWILLRVHAAVTSLLLLLLLLSIRTKYRAVLLACTQEACVARHLSCP